MATSDAKKEAMRELDRKTLTVQKAAQAEGKVLSYSEAFLKVIKREPELFRRYSAAPMVVQEQPEARTHDLTNFERTKISDAYQRATDEVTAKTPQRKGEYDSLYKQRIFNEVAKASPVLHAAYIGTGRVSPSDYRELKSRRIFED